MKAKSFEPEGHFHGASDFKGELVSRSGAIPVRPVKHRSRITARIARLGQPHEARLLDVEAKVGPDELIGAAEVQAIQSVSPVSPPVERRERSWD